MTAARLPRGGGSPTGQLRPQCEWQKTATSTCIDTADLEVRMPSGLILRVCYLHSLKAHKMGATDV